MKKIDNRDYKILAELDKDGKVSFNKIGRELKLSPSVIERRTKKLIEKKVIKNFKTIINYKKLGYTYYSVYALLQNMNEQKKENIIKYLKSQPLVGQVLLCDGGWQIVFGFFSKNIIEVENDLKKFYDLFGKYIKKDEKIVHIGSHHYYRGYLENKGIFRKEEPFLGKNEKQIKIDKKSYELLNIIRNDARLNYLSLEKKLKISIDQVRYRIKKLTREKIILGYWLHLDPQKLGLNQYRVLLKLKNVNQEVEKEFLDYLNNHENVIRVNKVFGSWNYFVDLETKTEGLRNFMEEFSNSFNKMIEEYEIISIYDEVNFTFCPNFPIN